MDLERISDLWSRCPHVGIHIQCRKAPIQTERRMMGRLLSIPTNAYREGRAGKTDLWIQWGEWERQDRELIVSQVSGMTMMSVKDFLSLFHYFLTPYFPAFTRDKLPQITSKVCLPLFSRARKMCSWVPSCRAQVGKERRKVGGSS